jgi:UDP-N-acetylmuramate dehydrogenase
VILLYSEYGVACKNASLENYNTYKIKCICNYLITVNNVVKLTNLIKYLEDNKVKYLIIGNGSNLILPDTFHGVVIKLNFKEITYNKNLVHVGSSVLLNKLSFDIINNNLSGLEWASGIPGTVGGSIINNAGAYNDEIMNYVESIEVLENNKVKIMKKNEIDYSYRHTSLKVRNLVILKANLRLLPGDKSKSLDLIKERSEKRNNTQPLEYPSAGSVFKNPEGLSAGKLIDDLNLKGYKIGGAMVSEKHANFIINYNNASSKDIKELIKYVHDKVLENNNIDLELEQQIID